MKNIKFRAYTGGNWLYFTLEQLTNNQEPVLENYNLRNWCQYTGLKDDNGKEIYEGDIVVFSGNGGRRKSKPVAVEMKNLGWFPFVGDYDEEYIDDFVEVIGNIFENPDLINNK